jgi:uncharacterized membrane protein YjfL (UPF0719 family)
MVNRVFRKIVLSLGSLHLTLMAVVGIWFWSSPTLFESRQPGRSLFHTADCASTALLGSTIPLSSSPLRAVSLVIYTFFVVPGLNLLVPAALFLALHIGYRRITNRNEAAKPSVVPASIGLLFLLAVNVVFLASIETTIGRHRVAEDSEWTFGQTLAILLLALPLRDVINFIIHVRHGKRGEEYTQKLQDALANSNMDEVKKAVRYADVRVEAPGMSSNLLAVDLGSCERIGSFPTALQFAAYHDELGLVRFVVHKGANLNTEGEITSVMMITN